MMMVMMMITIIIIIIMISFWCLVVFLAVAVYSSHPQKEPLNQRAFRRRV